MGSFKPHTFDPLELEILDLVYQAAWAQLIARDPNRNVSKDGRRQSALRKRISRRAFSAVVAGVTPKYCGTRPSKALGFLHKPVALPNHVSRPPPPFCLRVQMRMVPNWLVVMLRLNVSA